MADAANGANVPRGVAVAAGYGDGLYVWPAAQWRRLRESRAVVITVRAADNQGHVLDVENGDANPWEAPAWVQRRRAVFAQPGVYCNLSTWPACKAAFQTQAIAEPAWLIADWNNPTPHLLAGTVATQYAHDLAPGYDLSQVDPAWIEGLPPLEGTLMARFGIASYANGLWLIFEAEDGYHRQGITDPADAATFEAAGWTACSLSEAQVGSFPVSGAAVAPTTAIPPLTITGTIAPAP